jgi:hypothetical protein
LPGAVQARVVKVAHALLDFIYYAQFQSHTDMTLAVMENSLVEFDAHKDIFIDLDVREHFNIPKVHSMRHYVNMIKSHGALDGFNTETSERLHIDFAKNAYRASNKRDYVTQMTLWLQRQEAVYRFHMFLNWVGQNLQEKEQAEIDDDNEEECDVRDLDDARNLAQFSCGPGGSSSPYYLPKSVPHPNTPVSKISTDYEAPQFLSALTEYLTTFRITSEKPTERDRFDVYNQITVRLPHNDAIDDNKRLNRTRATPAVPDKPGKKGRLAQFDTAFIRESHNTNEVVSGTGLEGKYTG